VPSVRRWPGSTPCARAFPSPPPRDSKCWSRPRAGGGIEVDGGWVPPRSPEVTAGQTRTCRTKPRCRP
jgi:hypothetical protein